MDAPHLYRQIAEKIRLDILSGHIKPGDRLPPVREMSERWGCTIGTVQHAYQDLVRQGLVTSRAGQGTKVVERLPEQDETPLRRALLVHRAEAFLLEVLTAGYTPAEVERAVRLALDRWRIVEQEVFPADQQVLRFTGSHDLVMAWLAGHFPEIAPGSALELRFTGSLGGLIALAEGKAGFAGSHLWDEESDTYNAPFVRRFLPGKRTALVTLAHRRLGLIVPSGNPARIQGLADLARPGQRFINRQEGSGTRVWLDAALRQAGIDCNAILGYAGDEKQTHSAVAQAVAEDQADAGIGLEAAAIHYGLGFIPLTRERYDLVIPEPEMALPAIQSLVAWLADRSTHALIQNLGGYDTAETGQVQWVE